MRWLRLPNAMQCYSKDIKLSYWNWCEFRKYDFLEYYINVLVNARVSSYMIVWFAHAYIVDLQLRQV